MTSLACWLEASGRGKNPNGCHGTSVRRSEDRSDRTPVQTNLSYKKLLQ